MLFGCLWGTDTTYLTKLSRPHQLQGCKEGEGAQQKGGHTCYKCCFLPSPVPLLLPALPWVLAPQRGSEGALVAHSHLQDAPPAGQERNRSHEGKAHTSIGICFVPLCWAGNGTGPMREGHTHPLGSVLVPPAGQEQHWSHEGRSHTSVGVCSGLGSRNALSRYGGSLHLEKGRGRVVCVCAVARGDRLDHR